MDSNQGELFSLPWHTRVTPSRNLGSFAAHPLVTIPLSVLRQTSTFSRVHDALHPFTPHPCECFVYLDLDSIQDISPVLSRPDGIRHKSITYELLHSAPFTQSKLRDFRLRNASEYAGV